MTPTVGKQGEGQEGDRAMIKTAIPAKLSDASKKDHSRTGEKRGSEKKCR